MYGRILFENVKSILTMFAKNCLNINYAIDSTKIHNELGWLPQTKFENGIAKMIEWYLANKDWWQEIISGEYQKYYEKMYKNR